MFTILRASHALRQPRTRLAQLGVTAIAVFALAGCVSFPVVNVTPADQGTNAPRASESAVPESTVPESTVPDPAVPDPTPDPAPDPASARAPVGRVTGTYLAADSFRSADGAVRFLTPSGNIYCVIAGALNSTAPPGLSTPPALGLTGLAGVSCELGVYPDPAPADSASVDCGTIGHHGGNIAISDGKSLYGNCRGGATYMYLVATGQQSPPGVPVFEYGTAISEAGFRCHSAFEGLTCESETTGRGFFVSRDSYELYGG
ncbi:conserved hypothetical protein [Leucobacter sp. 7(1)]|uniref:DUF6636 domain-containing protein n=1 Tax=Leucobacter sp. 7(1) TaxID=1255613 RepID=UPI00097EA69A|nr:DUF6636 domain-containing protein [Leucobacter sp. 7(1)]SJN12181.1 conserved hypothetical protein [Leucobacter sp. 7(1)]